ncbi:MAG: GIY-YIG nuclease family protein [Candidatus Omnitrophica bacterium]|nr:GIY-YIG nuclease family protein [Candidatus Omnitrophota bacterium]
MYIVYILKSLKKSDQYYVGLTEDLERRLQNHNKEDNPGYSKRYAPWEVETYIFFRNRDRAIAFEKYLKFGSGYAFLRKRLI